MNQLCENIWLTNDLIFRSATCAACEEGGLGVDGSKMQLMGIGMFSSKVTKLKSIFFSGMVCSNNNTLD